MTTLEAPGQGSAGMGRVLAMMLVCSFLWATAFPLMKVIGADVGPVALTALRGIMGSVILGAFLVARGQNLRPRGREWRDWAVLGMLQGFVPNVLTAYGLMWITTGLTSMIQASTPLLVAAVAHLAFADERLTSRRLAGVLTGFAGMAILIGPAALGGQGTALPGILAMVATACSYAAGNIYIRAVRPENPSRLAFGQQTFAGLPALALALGIGGTGAFAGAADHFEALLALGLFATALPILLYMHIVSRAGPTLGSMNAYLVPVWTILIGVTLLAETVSPREMLGGAVVLAGIAIVSSARRAESRARP